MIAELSRITAWLIALWLAFRILDLTIRGYIATAFRFDIFAAAFWLETALLAFSVWTLRAAVIYRSPRKMFYGSLLAMAGGMLYRFDPTTTAFSPKPGAFYFPSVIELFISMGFVSIAVAAFIILSKVLPILPAPSWMSYAMTLQASKADRSRLTILRPEKQGYVTGD